MKILRISLRNIASLAGLQTVDFTQEPLQTAGLFAISGATGAGKSSLLDALCLALYDSTPRLNRVGRLDELSPGEKQSDPRTLLRRGCAEGLAEVAFVGVDGRAWTARWHARRARNRPDGNLQHTEMTLFRGHIAPGGTGPVEAGGKKTEVQAAILSKIGLTFEQFTRAVLLAQNDFATFLKADDRERAEILQALTGTEQFEAISRGVFERTSQEKKRLEQLKDRLQGHQPLSESDRQQAEADLQKAQQFQQEIAEQLAAVKQQIDWFGELRRRQQQHEQAQQVRDVAWQRLQAAAPRRMELQHTELVQREARSLREAQRTAATWVEQAQAEVARATAAVAAQTSARQQTATQLQAALERQKALREHQSAMRPVLDAARRLDALLPSAAQRLAQTTTARDQAQQHQQITVQQRQEAQQRQQQLTAEVSSLKDKLRERSQLLPFAEEASLWLDRIDVAVRSGTALHRCQQQHDQAVRALQLSREHLTAHHEQQAGIREVFSQAQSDFEAAQRAQSAFDEDQLAADCEQCEEAQRVLTVLQQHLTEVTRRREHLSVLQAEADRLAVQCEADQARLTQLRDQQIGQAEAAVSAAHSTLQMVQAAVDDAAERLRETLQEDHPCPVCGSVDHPYRHHAPQLEATAIQAAKQSLTQQQQRLRQLTDEAAQLEGRISSQTPQIAQCRAQADSLQSQLQAMSFGETDHPAVAGIVTLAEDRQLNEVEVRLQAAAEHKKKIDAQQKLARAAAQRTAVCRQKFESAREELECQQKQLTALESAQKLAAGSVEHCDRSLQDSRTQHANALLPLQQIWAGIPESERRFLNEGVEFRKWFHQQTQECQQLTRALHEHEAELRALAGRLDLLGEACRLATDALTRAQKEFDDASAHHEAQLKERANLLAGRAVDEVEQELSAQLSAITEECEELTGRNTRLDSELNLASSALQSAEQQCATAQTRADETCRQFQQWQQQFERNAGRAYSLEELDVMLARDQHWLQSEQQALDELNHRVKTAEGGVTAHAEQLQQHEKTRPPVESEETLAVKRSALEQQDAAAQERTNQARTVLHSDDLLRLKNQGVAEELRVATEKADPWLKLNELIGSADGAKFRMIAQRRTLDVLLTYANAHLQQLAARYRLQRLKDSLNLIVVDREMADERRSIHSLSGGESFLVSLALALGLASLTSSRLRIESLFIDEGFGSLDPETLNTAMNALMHLESQGRKVGVISHVTEMTDAIPVQVKIMKGRNGASRIVIPGTATDLVPHASLDEPQATATAPGTVSVKAKGGRGVNGTLFDDDTDPAEQLAGQVIEFLERRQRAGNQKTTLKLIRDEVGCDARMLTRVQLILQGRVQLEGRSLRLIVSQT